jgi:hypothetical protein
MRVSEPNLDHNRPSTRNGRMRTLTAALAAALLACSSAAADSPTEYPVAVVLLRSADTPAPSWGRPRVAAAFREVAQEYLDHSYGRLRIVPDIYGWYSLDAAGRGACPKDAMRTLGEAALLGEIGAAALARYRAIMFVADGLHCGDTDGTATIGGNPAYVWIFRSPKSSLIGHELAHALGRPHSRSRSCSPQGCIEHEYGDPYDRAGCGAATQHFNAAQKEAQGWLGTTGFPAIQVVRTSGTYSIDAYEPPGRDTSVRALKVPTGARDGFGREVFYYVESRAAAGRGRVLLHRASAGLDKPLTVTLVDLAPESILFDPVLDPGQVFSDPEAGLRFRTISSSDAGSVVLVDVATDRRAPVSTAARQERE